MKKSRANSAARRLVEMIPGSEYALIIARQMEEYQVSYLPLNIDVSNMTVLVAGGGIVAGRKIVSLLAAGAKVNVVAPELTPEIHQLASSGTIKAKIGRYHSNDLTGVFLAVAATNDPKANRKIAADSLKRGILVSVAGAPELGNCSFPALLKRGDLEISISTNGKCPGFAVEIRDHLASVISEEYGIILDTLATEREKLLTGGNSSTYNKQVLRSRARELINKLIEHKEHVP